jgi:hypothetical protein
VNTVSNRPGCNACWPSSADAAWEAVKSLKTDIDLIDESHFKIKIRSCKKCGQQFLSVFTETIDWKDGEDPQYWTVIPLTTEEAERLSSKGSDFEAALVALPDARRSLRHDFPKGSGPKSYWSQGLAIGAHD